MIDFIVTKNKSTTTKEGRMTLGVFDPELRENVHPYQKKRLGTVSYMDDGTAYPTTMGQNRPIPVFVDRTEFLERRNKTYFG